MRINLTTYLLYIIFDSVYKTSQVDILKAPLLSDEKSSLFKGGFLFAPLFPKKRYLKPRRGSYRLTGFVPDKKNKKNRRFHVKLQIDP
jgi:hypothetical protein